MGGGAESGARLAAMSGSTSSVDPSTSITSNSPAIIQIVNQSYQSATVVSGLRYVRDTGCICIHDYASEVTL